MQHNNLRRRQQLIRHSSPKVRQNQGKSIRTGNLRTLSRRTTRFSPFYSSSRKPPSRAISLHTATLGRYRLSDKNPRSFGFRLDFLHEKGSVYTKFSATSVEFLMTCLPVHFLQPPCGGLSYGRVCVWYLPWFLHRLKWVGRRLLRSSKLSFSHRTVRFFLTSVFVITFIYIYYYSSLYDIPVPGMYVYIPGTYNIMCCFPSVAPLPQKKNGDNTCGWGSYVRLSCLLPGTRYILRIILLWVYISHTYFEVHTCYRFLLTPPVIFALLLSLSFSLLDVTQVQGRKTGSSFSRRLALNCAYPRRY